MGIPTHVKVIVVEMLATAGVTMIVGCLVTAAMMPAKSAMWIANHLPSPAMADVVNKLRAAAGAMIFVCKTMTAAPMSAMNAISTAGSGFSWW